MVFWEKLKAFSTLYERCAEPVKAQYHLTQPEFDILMFLYNNPQYKNASDIVRVRHLTKSNVSATVASLEEKNLLGRSYGEGNRKSILLRLTPEAAEIVAAGKAIQATFGDALIRGFTQEEKEKFQELFQRISANVDAELDRRKK